MSDRARCSVFLFGLALLGCGSAAPARTTTPSDEPAPSTSAQPVLTVGAARWQFIDELSIDATGAVSVNGQRIGVLTPDGELREHGELVARIGGDGWIWWGESRSSIRVVGPTLVEVHPESAGHDEPFLRVEGDQLVMDETHETLAVEGLRPELATEVLFITGVFTIAMARGMSH